jgi:membrane-associated phospholipid phosphatase
MNAWLIITGAYVVLMALAQGISLRLGEIASFMLFGSACLAASYLIRKSAWSLLLKAMGVLNLFPILMTLAMNVTATTARPLADDLFIKFDGGVSQSIYAFAKSYSFVDITLDAIYRSVMVQTTIAILFLLATRQAERLDRFLLRFILCGLATIVGFYWLPAEGTVALGLSSPEFYQPMMTELHRLRAGVSSIGIVGSEGIITFPSFHTIWAVLLISAYHRSALFVPMLVINGLMVVSTMTTGMHYWIDVVGGLAICAAVIPATNPAFKWAFGEKGARNRFCIGRTELKEACAPAPRI